MKSSITATSTEASVALSACDAKPPTPLSLPPSVNVPPSPPWHQTEPYQIPLIIDSATFARLHVPQLSAIRPIFTCMYISIYNIITISCKALQTRHPSTRRVTRHLVLDDTRRKRRQLSRQLVQSVVLLSALSVAVLSAWLLSR